MQNIFDHRPPKMDLPEKFEKRTWRFDETFSNYFYDKVILANKVPVDEEELTDYSGWNHANASVYPTVREKRRLIKIF